MLPPTRVAATNIRITVEAILDGVMPRSVSVTPNQLSIWSNIGIMSLRGTELISRLLVLNVYIVLLSRGTSETFIRYTNEGIRVYFLAKSFGLLKIFVSSAKNQNLSLVTK